jgi:hypothetical protein
MSRHSMRRQKSLQWIGGTSSHITVQQLFHSGHLHEHYLLTVLLFEPRYTPTLIIVICIDTTCYFFDVLNCVILFMDCMFRSLYLPPSSELQNYFKANGVISCMSKITVTCTITSGFWNADLNRLLLFTVYPSIAWGLWSKEYTLMLP